MKRLLLVTLAFFMYWTFLWSQNRSYNNPDLLRYIQAGASRNDILELSVKPAYGALSLNQQKQLLQLFYADFPSSKIVVKINSRESQLWIPQEDGYVYASGWNIDELPLKDYGPLELNKYGSCRFFYYVGGSFGSAGGVSNGMINLRAGTFLFKDIWDISATLNLGYMRANYETQFNGDIGAMTRVYSPWRIPKVNLVPYVGLGVSLLFTPKALFDGQALTGLSWFIGPGSFDLGLKYGIQSGFSATFGYTFRINLKT